MKRGNKKFNNRLLYSLISLILIMVVLGGVYALQQVASGGTHNYGEIGLPSCSNGQVLKWLDGNYICGVDIDTDTNTVIAPFNGVETWTATIKAADLDFGYSGRRGSPGKALVDLGGSLVVNYGASWSNVVVQSPLYAKSFIYDSDISLKENIKPLTNSLDKINRLQGVSFNWKINGNESIGLIAQDVEEVLPELVHTNEEGLKGVEYGNLVALLIEAVKEQQQEIDELKSQLNK